MQISEEELDVKKISAFNWFYARSTQSGKWKNYFYQRRVERKIFSKCLRPKDDEFVPGWLEDQEKELRKVKILPENVPVHGMTFIYDEKVAVITPKKKELDLLSLAKLLVIL